VPLVAVGANLAQASPPLHCSCRTLILIAPGNALPRSVADNEEPDDRGEDDEHQVADLDTARGMPLASLGAPLPFHALRASPIVDRTDTARPPRNNLPLVAGARRRARAHGCAMRAALLVVASTGCFAQTTAGMTAARGAPSGGRAELAVGDSAFRDTASVSVQQVARDDGSTTTAVALDAGFRGSLLGALVRERDWARWLDFGADAGAGAGMHGLHGFGRAWAGGWADVRVAPRHERYPILRAQIRRVAYTDGIANETELMVGVGWTVRGEPRLPGFFSH